MFLYRNQTSKVLWKVFDYPDTWWEFKQMSGVGFGKSLIFEDWGFGWLFFFFLSQQLSIIMTALGKKERFLNSNEHLMNFGW